MKLALTAAVLAVLLVVGYFYAGPPSWPEVTVVRPQRADLEANWVASGQVRARTVEVSSVQGGRVAEVPVEINHPVKRGDLLVQLDDSQQLSKVQSLESGLMTAQSRYNEAVHSLNLKSSMVDASVAKAEAQQSEAAWNLQLATGGPRPQELESAKSKVTEAEAEFYKANRERQRLEQLFKEDIVSRMELDRALADEKMATARRDRAQADLQTVKSGKRYEEVQAARARVQAAEADIASAERGRLELPILQERARAAELEIGNLEAQIRAARAELDRTRLRSPMAGVVSQRRVEPGEVAAPGQTIVELVTSDRLWVEADVDEQDAAQVRLDQPVTVRFTSLPGREFAGQVARVSPSLEKPADLPGNARVLRIKVDLKEAPEDLRPGLEADVEGHTVLARGSLIVPRAAVYRQDDKDYVMAVVGGRTRSVPVQLGALTAYRAEIKSGVSEGTDILAEGRGGLQENERVRAVAAKR